MSICDNPACQKEFEKATHNQRYCCAECCRIVTNERIKKQYHEDRARLNGKERMCKGGCGVKLSRYNTSKYCSSCQSRSNAKIKQIIKDKLGVSSES
jgi:hypothetical protein